MPIKNLTDDVRLPRLGKIRLGIKVTNDKGVEYPQKTDYFVLDTEHSAYRQLVKLYGEKPKELPIMIPVEDEEVWATQYYKSYNLTYGLVCKGDGENAVRMVDTKTQQLPVANKAGTVTMIDYECHGSDCPDYKTKKCHEVMNLRFILPEVPGLGVWQIDTGSKNSILNINSCAKLIKRAFGRLSMIPLKLTFEPMQVNNPETGKKQTVYVLNIRTDITISQLADVAREQIKYLSAGTLEDAYDIEVEKDFALFDDNPPNINPQEKVEQPPEAPQSTQSEPETESKGNGKPGRNPKSITSVTELQKACKSDFGMERADCLKELNITSWPELAITPKEAYQQISAVRNK